MAEMDIMNKSELIYDNACLLSFVCLTYNLTIEWQIASKVRLVAHVLYIDNGELATYFDQITVVNFQKSMGHEVSNERASDNVRRGGCAYCLNKNYF